MHTHTHTHTHYYQTRERETSLLKHMKAHSTVLIEFLWKMFSKKKSCLFCCAGETKLSGCEFFSTHERIELNVEIVIPNFIGFVQSWPSITDTCHSPQFQKYFSCSLPNWSQKTIFELLKNHDTPIHTRALSHCSKQNRANRKTKNGFRKVAVIKCE
jgi:hypothetical protein